MNYWFFTTVYTVHFSSYVGKAAVCLQLAVLKIYNKGTMTKIAFVSALLIKLPPKNKRGGRTYVVVGN